MSSTKTGFAFYRDVFGSWRWEYTDGAGNVIDSNVSYETREACVAASAAARVNGAEPKPRAHDPLDAIAGRSIMCACPDLGRHAFLRDAFEPAEPVIVARGDAALKALNGAIFDAYVLDFWLPDWSGVSLSREIRKTDPHVPIVFFSKAASDDAKRRALRAGADAFLTTPRDDAALRRRVSSLISARHRANLDAQRAAQDAVAQEVGARLVAADSRAPAAEVVVTTIERRARVRAMEAFISSGGTRAAFERTWTGLFSRADVSMRLSSQSA